MKKNRVLFTFCLAFSLSLHLFFLYLLQKSFLVSPAQPKLVSTFTLENQALTREKVLKETFQAFTPQSSSENALEKQQPPPLSLPPKINIPNLIIQKPPFQPEEEISSLLQFHLSQKFDELLAKNDVPLLLKPPSLASEILPLNLVIPTTAAPETPHKQPTPDPQIHPELPFVAKKTLSAEPHKSPPLAFSQTEMKEKELSDPGASKRASLSIPSPVMPSFPSLEELDTKSYSDWFDVELVCSPKEDGSGYLFALTLIPRIEMELSTLRQHYTFLIDRSNSIQKERLSTTKSAVLRALDELAPHDTFNILTFDSKVEKLFPSSRKADALSISLAKTFLNKITLGSFFSPANLYNPLALSLPQSVQEDELYNVILFTDGESLSKKGAVRSLLENWTRQSRGTVSLFTVNMSSDTNLPSLEAATALNKGWVTPTQTTRGLKRKLLKVMKSIHTPLAKNLMCRVIPLSSQSKLEIFPRQEETPNLYLDHPFVILGSTETLDNFILFIQGRLHNRWLNIKKTISFVNAKQGSHALKREWALRTSYQCYEHYFKENNPIHLDRAREILAAFDLTPVLP